MRHSNMLVLQRFRPHGSTPLHKKFGHWAFSEREENETTRAFSKFSKMHILDPKVIFSDVLLILLGTTAAGSAVGSVRRTD